MTSVLWQKRVENRRLGVVHGDITLEPVDAIVNAANEYLQHGGGVAGAIVLAGGSAIQEACDELIDQLGSVPTGTAVITEAGRLHASKVIHAVGPIWGAGNEEQLLESAINSSLNLAEENGLLSISFPAISSGIFGFPKELCAKVFVRTLQSWLVTNTKRSLVEIRLCNNDSHTAEIFEQEARRVFGNR